MNCKGSWVRIPVGPLFFCGSRGCTFFRFFFCWKKCLKKKKKKRVGFVSRFFITQVGDMVCNKHSYSVKGRYVRAFLFLLLVVISLLDISVCLGGFSDGRLPQFRKDLHLNLLDPLQKTEIMLSISKVLQKRHNKMPEGIPTAALLLPKST